jgi:hypothetical protein
VSFFRKWKRQARQIGILSNADLREVPQNVSQRSGVAEETVSSGEAPAGGAPGFKWNDFIIPVIGAVGLIIGFFYIWSEYSFQQEKVAQD